MWHIGIDLHRRTVVMAMVHDSGEVGEPTTLGCRETDRIVEFVRRFKPFRAVIEATSTYRWLYDLSTPEGTVLLAHPAKLRLMIQRRAKIRPVSVSSSAKWSTALPTHALCVPE